MSLTKYIKDSEVRILVKSKNKMFDFKGFKLSENFKSALKNCLYTLVPAILTELVSNNVIATGSAALIGPMVLKAIEYSMNKK